MHQLLFIQIDYGLVVRYEDNVSYFWLFLRDIICAVNSE